MSSHSRRDVGPGSAFTNSDDPTLPDETKARHKASKEPLPPLSELLGPGPFRCRCGVEIQHWGCCSACSVRYAQEQQDKALASARSSIPERFRWAKFRKPDGEIDLLRERLSPQAYRGVVTLRPPYATGIALVGDSGAGKTSLACAFLARIHDHVEPESPWHVLDTARSARFVAARDIEAAAARLKRYGQADQNAERLMAHVANAAILVVDNVEPAGLESAVGAAIMDRHDADRQCTIITTWMTEEQAAKNYGQGWARRCYEQTVELPKREKVRAAS